ncbi:hypothetical protein [Burkholderia diffusa]|uniref:hypothetical protein n=1 Tax=Burkholderia diffusa TaxID=488732 RepID=UPI00158B9C49|nr:hypothetical protein [Burkholderia diffusa]
MTTHDAREKHFRCDIGANLIAETCSCKARFMQNIRDGATFLRVSIGRFVCCRQVSHRFAQSRDACVKQKFARGAAALSAAPSHPHAATLARRLYVVPIRQTAHRATKPRAMQSK